MNSDLETALNHLSRLDGRSGTMYQKKLSKHLINTTQGGKSFYEKEVEIRFTTFRDLLTPESPLDYEKYRDQIESVKKFRTILASWYKTEKIFENITYNGVNIGSAINMKLAITIAGKIPNNITEKNIKDEK